jgi:hypothetical protein
MESIYIISYKTQCGVAVVAENPFVEGHIQSPFSFGSLYSVYMKLQLRLIGCKSFFITFFDFDLRLLGEYFPPLLDKLGKYPLSTLQVAADFCSCYLNRSRHYLFYRALLFMHY